MEEGVAADPAGPMVELPTKVAADALDFAAAVGPYAFALLVAVLMVGFTVKLIRAAA